MPPTNHIAWAHVGESGAEQALIRQVGWLASWSSLAAPARSSHLISSGSPRISVDIPGNYVHRLDIM